VAGVKFWSWGDNFDEKVNFGLVSFSDNAYDGREAVVNLGTDPWGWPTGGEERNYGDFLSAVVDINTQISRWLVRDAHQTVRRRKPAQQLLVQRRLP
jgi:hypothetical protein